MYRKILILIFISLLSSLTLFAQEEDTEQKAQPTVANIKIGFLSYDEALHAMPEYAIVQTNLHGLRSQYDDEMQRAEKEFNEKYEFFLEGLKTMADAIREKRQSELQSMMERNVAFKKESARLISQAEKEAMAPLYERLQAVIADIAESRAYIMVVNTDSNACPYLSPVMAEDISTLVIDRLKTGYIK